MTTWLAALLAAAAVASWRRPRAEPAGPRPVRAPVHVDWLPRYRLLWVALAACGAWSILGGPVGVGGAVLAGGGCWLLVARAEPREVRVRREAARRDLPVLVQLLATALVAGAAPGEALVLVVDALPGPSADALSPVVARLRLGVDPGEAWQALAAVGELAPLGRTLSRAHASGAPVAAAVERLGVELARSARAEAEERARQVGVKAAVPLGLCLLPAFLLIGIVPVVGGLLSGLGL